MTKYTATFESGAQIVKTSADFKNQVAFHNWICKNKLGKKYGKLESIECAPYGRD